MISPQDKYYSRQRKIYIILVGGFSFLFLSKLIYWLPKDILENGLSEWVYSDWLIDYSAGFVRRGLSGELIKLLSLFVSPRIVVGVLSWSIFVVFAIAYTRYIIHSLDLLNPILFAGLLFMPSLLPFYLYAHTAFGRKEIIGFLILLWHLYLVERYGTNDANLYFKKVIPIIPISLSVQILVHEASFLLFVPVHFLISHLIIRQNVSWEAFRRKFTVLIIYLPVILCLIAVIIFGRPSFKVATTICKNWVAAGALELGSCDISGKDPVWALPGQFTSLPWSFSQAISLSMSFSIRTVLSWCFIFAILGFFTIFLGSNVADALLKGKYSPSIDMRPFPNMNSWILILKYFAFPLVLSLPLYILGWDIGRWFAVICINFVLITLSRNVVRMEFRIIENSYVKTLWTRNGFGCLFNKFGHFVFLFIYFLSISSLRLPTCCINVSKLLSEPVKFIIINLLSEPVKFKLINLLFDG